MVLLSVLSVSGMLAFATGGSIILQIVAAAEGAPTMRGAFATTALDVGALVGPIVAGRSLAAFGPSGPAWCAAVAVAVVLLLAARRPADPARG